jgi:hypothetical protein
MPQANTIWLEQTINGVASVKSSQDSMESDNRVYSCFKRSTQTLIAGMGDTIQKIVEKRLNNKVSKS